MSAYVGPPDWFWPSYRADPGQDSKQGEWTRRTTDGTTDGPYPGGDSSLSLAPPT